MLAIKLKSMQDAMIGVIDWMSQLQHETVHLNHIITHSLRISSLPWLRNGEEKTPSNR